MAKTNITSVDDYIFSQPEPVHAALERVRNAIRKALPTAEEVISYGIPTYKISGAAVIYFGAWKQHYSLYPASGQLIDAFRADLAAYEVRKSTLRFPYSAPVPVKLIERIAKFRAQELGGRTKVKALEPKARE